jgi:type II secretion system protein G
MQFLVGQQERTTRQLVNRRLSNAMLSCLVVVMLTGAVNARLADCSTAASAKEVRRDLAIIISALHQYRLDNRVYPSMTQGLEALVIQPGNLPKAINWREEGYLKNLPSDPWGNDYQYQQRVPHGPFEVYSLGADGRQGGTGEDADISLMAG